MITFQELGLSSELLRSLKKMGFETATQIQKQTIPLAVQGCDLLGQAQTGTGKTAAFGIPLIEQISLEVDSLQALVITPTRELAMQVAEELNRIGEYKKVRALAIYGGQDINRQIRSLKKRPQIIVGTPGRLQDHIRRRTIRLQQLNHIVLDEADEMLQMGFREEIEEILLETPTHRQILLFSATMPQDIRILAKKFMYQPKEIRVKTKSLTLSTIEQFYIKLHPKQKFDVLCNLIDLQTPELAIVFGSTKKRVDEITEGLIKRGYSAEGLHGDFTQAHRNSVIRHLREGTIDIMVATDVAARGLDVPNITHIYNFDIPQDAEGYVHRIGRTGRAGQAGISITFITAREQEHLRSIERITKHKMKQQSIPSKNEVLAGKQQIAVNALMSVIEKGAYQKYTELAEKLLEQTDTVTLLSAALKMITKESDSAPVTLTNEPMFFKKSAPKKKQNDRRQKKYSTTYRSPARRKRAPAGQRRDG